MKQIAIGDITADVVQKDVKYVHLSVYPPVGRVKVAAPKRFDIDTIRAYLISKLRWIRRQQNKFKSQEREQKRDYVTGESHYYLGKRYILKVFEECKKSDVILLHSNIELYTKNKATKQQKQKLFENWQRKCLSDIALTYIEQWEEKLGIKILGFSIRKMKTRWGTYKQKKKKISLNLELVKKPPHCIEYVVLHELIHFFERLHNERFKAYLNEHMPQWRMFKKELNMLVQHHDDCELVGSAVRGAL